MTIVFVYMKFHLNDHEKLVGREAKPRHFITWKIVIDFNKVVYNKTLKIYDFFYVGAHSHDEKELMWKDLYGVDLKNAVKDGKYLLEFYSNKIPVTWTIWPYNKL